ncbi:MAG TPA: hypothetical protein VFP84_29355 [Kofleriaceae bacterium]|nr:hypothetical protein [Kofleriaceae bacterium]
MTRRPYIVSPAYDWVFFLASPLLCLGLGIAVSGSWVTQTTYALATERDTLVGFFTGVMTHAHLVAVGFRSHANPAIRARHPVRFLVVPIALWCAIVSSPWIAVASTVVATFWDVWHSGAQTFGFARIYERNHGTPPEVARRLDFWMNQLLYAGPILAGVTLTDHIHAFDGFTTVGDALFSSVPARVEGHRGALAEAVVIGGGVFIIAYVLAHVRLARAGHRPSWRKVWIIASTGAVSIYTWAFNSWGEAFLIMNLFHAVQYLALVWAIEGRRIAAWMRLPGRPRLALGVYLGVVLLYGLGVEALDANVTTLWAITMVVSLMHFWYDAFVWSVRRAEI